jgi:hypothetical protein
MGSKTHFFNRKTSSKTLKSVAYTKTVVKELSYMNFESKSQLSYEEDGDSICC